MKEKDRYNYPSVILTKKQGEDIDEDCFASFLRVEVNKLLYQLKNHMKFLKLGQLKMTRSFPDGTVIVAKSIFGHDFVEIKKGTGIYEEDGGLQSCYVTLYNVPDAIPPMMWYPPWFETLSKVGNVWELRKPNGEIEIEGVDYIKTYYSVSISNCSSCSPVKFTVATGEDAWFKTGTSPNRPFWYQAEHANGSLIYNYNGDMVPHADDNPLDHHIYGLEGRSQAEIVKFDVDENGTYFLWKAYTEWNNFGPFAVGRFSRTGLGYMLLKGFIENQSGILCESDGIIIKVDCCLKPLVNRAVKLLVSTSSTIVEPGCSFFTIGGGFYCELGPTISFTKLIDDAFAEVATFFVFPEILGGCIPFQWTLSGPGRSSFGGPGNSVFSYYQPEDWGTSFSCEPIIITVRDRCGTTKSVTADCCSGEYWESGPIAISYTSLSMACGAQQNLEAGGGCPPYNWSISSGGGSIWVDPNYAAGDHATYTAPGTNANCANNPTVTLTDCCGNSAEIKLAVSCYTSPPYAIRKCSYIECLDNCNTNWKATFCAERWDCNGVKVSSLAWDGSGPATCGECGDASYLTCPKSDWLTPVCGAGAAVICENPAQSCGTVMDIRTTAMKSAGCCPINPFTGLPY